MIVKQINYIKKKMFHLKMNKNKKYKIKRKAKKVQIVNNKDETV